MVRPPTPEAPVGGVWEGGSPPMRRWTLRLGDSGASEPLIARAWASFACVSYVPGFVSTSFP
eukprot:15440081-Alexandrium_andersonii.AAC.1